MTELKWKEFVRLYWTALSYWEMIKAFRSHELKGPFFGLAALASRNSLLWAMANFVELCIKTDSDIEFGDEATKTLDILKAIYDKGKKERGSKDLNYEDCGVGTFRDIQLGHPVNAIKVVKGKDGYEISLEWKTVEETLDKIMLFAEQVEAYHREKGTWNVSNVKAGMLDVEFAFADLVKDLEGAQKYAEIMRAVLLKGGFGNSANELREKRD